MNPSYYLNAFIPPHQDVESESLKALLLSALEGMNFKVELDAADEDDGLNDLLNEEALQELSASGIHDFDGISRDLLLTIDGYPILVAITDGDDAAELAGAYDETDGLTDEDLNVLERTKCCIELFAEENDPGQRYLAAMEAIADRFRSEWGAVVLQGEVLD